MKKICIAGCLCLALLLLLPLYPIGKCLHFSV